MKRFSLSFKFSLPNNLDFPIEHAVDRFHYLSNRKHIQSSHNFLSFSSLLHCREVNLNIYFQSKKVLQVQEISSQLPSISHCYNKMKCWAQIFTTPTADTPGTTLLLHFDSRRYIFGNLAEGTQRASVQRKIGLLKVSDLFLTGKMGWNNTGGLLGMILTLADIRSSSLEERKNTKQSCPGMAKQFQPPEKPTGLTLHGGRNLTHLLATSRRFIFRKGMPISTNEFTVKRESTKSGWEPSWKDENIKIWAMPIEPECSIATSRKRSHDEFDNTSTWTNNQVNEDKAEYQADMARKSVVSSMFDSTWRIDSLVTKKLCDVQLPATIFKRGDDGKVHKYTGPMVAEDSSVANLEVLIRNPWPGALVEQLPSTTPSNTSICYIIQNYNQRGKFDPQKAMELGVKRGPDFSRLTKGESIITPSGTTVTPEMVLGKGKDGGGFAILELPDKNYIEPCLSRKEWSSDIVMRGVGVIIWILGSGVLNDMRLKKFIMERQGLKHIVSSSECCSNYLALESTATAAIRLNMLDSKHFPIPNHSNLLQSDSNLETTFYEKLKCGLVIQLEPSIEIQRELVVPLLNTPNVVLETPEAVMSLAKIARKEVEDTSFLSELAQNQADIPSKDAEVISLGTGSSLPSKYRNVSATMVRVPGYGNYLFDCGENTLGQMKRVFGGELSDILRNLKAIWISHLHADHHLGTVSVIKAWHEETRKFDIDCESKLTLVSHSGMINWLGEYAEIEDYGQGRINLVTMNERSGFVYKPGQENSTRMGFSSIQACPVDHCAGALAVVVEFPNGFKIAYSGDCRPSDRFAKIGRGATLLIHEATFDDELLLDAISKKHSTTSEALDIGRKMGARRILLTHFSQRYQKIPIMNSNHGKSQVAIVAFDYMRIKIEDFAKMEAFKPALMKLFEQKEEKEE